MVMKVNYFQWICKFIFLTTLIGYSWMDMVMKVNYFQWICTFIFLTTLIRVRRDGYGYGG